MSSGHLSAPRPGASSSRAVALSVLLSCNREDSALDELIGQKTERSPLDARDRALVMELAYGVLRRQETIDWRLSFVLTKPLLRLPVIIQMLLRLGAYQLLFLDRIPASAAVNETVLLGKSFTKKLGRDWGGLINAVLRNLIRIPEPSLPDPVIQPVEALSVRYAVPSWLCRRWIDGLGYPRAEAVCRTISTIPSVALRVNQRRLTRQNFLARLEQAGIAARPTMISPVGVILEKGHPVSTLPGFEAGDFYVEDEAAQLIPPLLDPHPGDIVLDACAAPGGKTTHLAELMDNRGQIFALDRQKDRLSILQENCRRLGVSIIIPICGDARRSADVLRRYTKGATAEKSLELVDRILLDAPCSGLGVLRRHPEAKWKKHTAMFPRHQELQAEILAAVSAVLRPGGVLVYSTCSTEPEETEDVVDGFCQVRREWTRESVAPWLPVTALPFVTARGAFSTMGNECGMDGFYAARLRKVS